MSDSATLVVTIIGATITWTTSVVALVAWLFGRFRSLEVLIYKEINAQRKDLDDIATRVYRLELKAFGFTFAEGLSRTSDPSDDRPQ